MDDKTKYMISWFMVVLAWFVAGLILSTGALIMINTTKNKSNGNYIAIMIISIIEILISLVLISK